MIEHGSFKFLSLEILLSKESSIGVRRKISASGKVSDGSNEFEYLITKPYLIEKLEELLGGRLQDEYFYSEYKTIGEVKIIRKIVGE